MEPEAVIGSNCDEVCENFDDMVLKEEFFRGIYAYFGFEVIVMRTETAQVKNMRRTVKTLLISRSARMSQGLNAPLCRGKSTSMALRRAVMTSPKRFGRKIPMRDLVLLTRSWRT